MSPQGCTTNHQVCGQPWGFGDPHPLLPVHPSPLRGALPGGWGTGLDVLCEEWGRSVPSPAHPSLPQAFPT